MTGIWLAFILEELAGFLILWIYSRRVCKNSGGTITDIFLIEQKSPNLILDVSTQASVESAVNLSKAAIEILENIEKINVGKIVDVDIRIKSEDQKIVIAVRDNGVSFNPLEYQPQENYATDGGVWKFGKKNLAAVSDAAWNLSGLAGSRCLQRAFSSDAERRN